jgi:protein-tyrosine-phosphatase
VTRVLFVCTGTICRSPLAEALLAREFTGRGASGFEITSAGTGAWDGAPASEGAYLVALEHGLDLSAHRARLLTRDTVKRADLVLTMARHHRTRVMDLGGEGKVQVLGEFVGRSGPEAEVPDPFGSDIDIYRETYAQLEQMVRSAADRLIAERKDADHRA